MRGLPLFLAFALLAACGSQQFDGAGPWAALAAPSCRLAWDGGAQAKQAGYPRVAEAPDPAGFIQAWNRVPPTSNVVADRVFIGLPEDRNENLLVIFVEGGCVVGLGEMDMALARQLLGVGA